MSDKMLRIIPFCGRIASQRCYQPVMSGPLIRNYWGDRRRDLWDPFSDMERSMNRMMREMDRFSPFASLRNRFFEPLRCVPVETTEDGQRLYKMALDLGPDFRPEDVNVTVKDKTVTIKAKRETEQDGCKQLREYTYQYSLPEDVNIETVKSLLTNEGMLTISAPLPPPKEPKVTEIPINKLSDK